MMAGAAAMLGAQWALIPRLGLSPRALILWGSLIAAAGLVGTMLASDLYGITIGFALSSLGFGFTRPGFTGGASLAVPLAEQGAVAGVITAANGQQALDIMQEKKPSIVLMDMNLPILDGWAASRRAKEDENIRHIPIIALTAHATEEYKQYALAAGCDDYATKPVDFPGLLIKIQKLTRRA